MTRSCPSQGAKSVIAIVYLLWWLLGFSRGCGDDDDDGMN